MRPEWFLEDEVPFDRMWIDDRLWLPTFLAGGVHTLDLQTLVYGSDISRLLLFFHFLSYPNVFTPAHPGETFSCYALFKGETTIVDYDLRAGLVQPEIFRTKWACTQPTLALLPGL